MFYQLTLLFVIFSTYAISQSKIQTLYESKKFEKCIKLCEENLSQGIEKQKSLLFKSLILTEAQDEKYVYKNYDFPEYEALKCLKRIEDYQKKNMKDSFYKGYSRQIKQLRQRINETSDKLYNTGEHKQSLKLTKKLFEIYPDELLYTFYLARLFDFDYVKFSNKIDEIYENDYYNSLYELAENSGKHLKKSSKTELINALKTLIIQDNCDIQTASLFLVMYKRNHGGDDIFYDLENTFREKYWQIDMVIRVNEHRSTGYTCGDEDMKAMPPLILDNCLVTTTQKYAELCLKEKHFSHTGPDGSSPWKRASDEGCYADGENIAWGSSTVKGALNQWMNSTGHCKNIMGYHTKMGIGNAGTYWVQLFK
jgi:tetratricopeptide (TPR) repeat protein